MRPILLLSVLFTFLGLAAQTEGENLRLEGKRRNEALVQGGYNLTHGMDLNAPSSTGVTLLEVLFPGGDHDSRLNIWLQTLSGEAHLRFTDPDGKPVMTWSGQQGELSCLRRMVAGNYILEIDARNTTGGRALLGVKGPVLVMPRLDPARTEERQAEPNKGFHWPYLLFLPKEVKSTHILVVPNNTGFATENLVFLRASAAAELQRHIKLAERLGCPLLVPTFPRPSLGDENLYLHALTRNSLLEPRAALKRVDLQLIYMMEDAHLRLKAKGLTLSPKALMWGFSASGSFVNRFAMLHPEHVFAVASGSPGGWPIAPLTRLAGEALNYPIGIADVKVLTGQAVSLNAAKRVAWFFFMGDKDVNDAVVFRDSFSKSDEELIFRQFGPTPLARWNTISKIYADQGLRAQFRLYPGAAHSVTPDMHKDIADFFEQELSAVEGKPKPGSNTKIGE